LVHHRPDHADRAWLALVTGRVALARESAKRSLRSGFVA
jgi:hypothetical protein